MEAAIRELQKSFLDERQVESSRTIMGLDTQLVDDGTYFVVEADGELAGCGGWSRRSTLYGADQTPGRSAAGEIPSLGRALMRRVQLLARGQPANQMKAGPPGAARHSHCWPSIPSLARERGR